MHIEIAKIAIVRYALDKIIFVPTGDKYKKDSLINSNYRYQMLKIAISKYNDFEISDYEIRNGQKSTYQTLEYFQKQYPTSNIYFILGSDNLKRINTWENYIDILKKYKLIVVKRDNIDYLKGLANLKEYKDNIIVSDIKTKSLSSTKIRNLINSGNKKVIGLLDKEVLKFIKENNLYR